MCVMATQSFSLSLMYFCLLLAVIIRIRQISDLLVLDRHLPENNVLVYKEKYSSKIFSTLYTRDKQKNGNCMETKLFLKK